jgi:hypothetical protein
MPRALFIICGIVLFALALNFCLWICWRDGVVIAEVKNPRSQEIIRVRDLPSSAPFWAASFGRLGQDHLYRCEYYNYSMSQFLSSQTYSDRGYLVNSASVSWQADGTATVSLATSPHFTCKDGWWAKYPSR